MNRLNTVQLKLISAIFDGQDILCCTATGDGKSAAFSIPCLMLWSTTNTLSHILLICPPVQGQLALWSH